MSTEDEASKSAHATDDAVGSDNDVSPPEHANEDDQRGVADVEAVTLAWSRTSLILVFLK